MGMDLDKKVMLSDGNYFWGEIKNGIPQGIGIIGKRGSEAVKVTHDFDGKNINAFSMVREESGDCHIGFYEKGVMDGMAMDFGNRMLSFGWKIKGEWCGPVVTPNTYGSFFVSFRELTPVSYPVMLVYEKNNIYYKFYKNSTCVKSILVLEGIDLKHNFNYFNMEMAPFKYCDRLHVEPYSSYFIARQGDKYYKDGYGFCRFIEGDFGFGEFKNGSRTGMGFYQFENGDTYFGQFIENKVNGFGCYADARITHFSYGLFDPAKKKNGVHFEYESHPFTLTISKYRNGVKYGDSVKIDWKTYNLTHYPEFGNPKEYNISKMLRGD